MSVLPAAGYLADATRTKAEEKVAVEAWLAATRQLIGAGGAPTTLVISSGSITPTAGLHIVDTEGAAIADDLTNIVQTNLPDGSLLLLRPSSSTKVVIVKHSAGGTGQIAVADAADFSLVDPTMWLLLKRTGAIWDEVGRFYGSQAAAFRTRYDLATLGFGPNRFTKTQELAKGADLASVTALTLGADGNYFVVTGTTNISSISNKSVGTRILLQFAGVLTLAHSSNLVLQNGQSVQTSVGDLFEFISIGTGQWREINRHLASQPPGFFEPPETSILAFDDFTTRVGGDGTTFEIYAYTWAIAGTFSKLADTARGIVRALTDSSNFGGMWGGAAVTVAMLPDLRVRYAPQGSATAGKIRRVGWFNSSPMLGTEPNDAIYFRSPNTAAGNFFAVTRAAGAETAVDTGIPATINVFRNLKILASNSLVAFYINDTLVATIATTIPSSLLSPGQGCFSGIVNDGGDVDFFASKATR